jgi:hypothetical protein
LWCPRSKIQLGSNQAFMPFFVWPQFFHKIQVNCSRTGSRSWAVGKASRWLQWLLSNHKRPLSLPFQKYPIFYTVTLETPCISCWGILPRVQCSSVHQANSSPYNQHVLIRVSILSHLLIPFHSSRLCSFVLFWPCPLLTLDSCIQLQCHHTRQSNMGTLSW